MQRTTNSGRDSNDDALDYEEWDDTDDYDPAEDEPGPDAIQGAGQSLALGLNALRQVRHASKMRADCEADVREIRRGLEEDCDELAHREDVERNYEIIVSEEEAEISDAQAEIADTEKRIAHQHGNLKRLREELRQMRERHEQKLRPYRNLMDSSRGRSDDAAKSLANVRRSVRNAERALNEATKNRDARISSAHRAVDNAQERVAAVEAELETLQLSGTPDEAGPAALAKVERELASNRASLEAARTDVVQVTQEAQESVDQAQRRLLTLQREQAQAEKVAETNKAEATARKDEYDGLFREAQAKEKAHEDSIKACETRIRDLTQSREDAQDRMDEAKDILKEAHEIHAHPETTEGLRERIANEEADLADAEAELEELTQTERELRRSTRASRLVILAIVAVVLVLVIVLVWYFVLRG